MKRLWTAAAVALISIFAIAGCNDYGNTFQANTGASIRFLSPSNVSAGSPDFQLTITGTRFVAKTYVTWNGKKLDTTVPTDSSGTVLGTSVIASVPAALVAKAGTATIETQNPFSGAGNNGLSNPVIFIINPAPNPMPSLTSVTPSSIAACGTTCADLVIDLQGSNFLSSSDASQTSQVHWTAGATQTTLATTSVSATDIKATVPGALLSAEGTASVTVFNPPSPQTTPPGGTPNPSAGGGGTSAAQTFTITSASGHGAHATVNSASEETPAVSGDGRYVAYAAQGNEHAQIFVHDTCEGAPKECKAQTTTISVGSDGADGNADSNFPSMSANGRYIAFSSAATNLAANSSSGRQVYLRDTCAGADADCTPSTQLISTDANGALGGTEAVLPSISASGRFVAFLSVMPSHAANQSADTSKSDSPNSGYRQVFVRDTCLGASGCTPKTTRISLQPGDLGSAINPAGPAVGANGKSVGVSGRAATVFTRSVPVDDRLFLAITAEK
jgi:hypothetical protein